MLGKISKFPRGTENTHNEKLIDYKLNGVVMFTTW